MHKRTDIPLYHPQVETYEVKDVDGTSLGILYLDYYTRASKSAGAWMTEFRHYTKVNGQEEMPLVSVVYNFSPAVGDAPVLLSWDDTETMFHEFGHALHGFFTRGDYQRIAGTIPHDMVELPSQVMENWASEPEVLKMYGKHYLGIDSYTTLNLVKPNGVVPVGSSQVVTLGNMRNTNPDLKWEVKRTFNAGVDLGMFGNRLLFSLNYYNSKTSDMLYLYNVSVPPFTYNTLLANIGSMRNSGTEIAVGLTPLKTQDMELNVNVNVTFQQNKLLSLSGMYGGENISAPEYKSLASLDGAGFHGGYNHIVYQMVGQPLGVFYLPHCKGLIADGNGGYTYDIADLNGGGVSLEDGEDRYVAGQAVPKTLLGSNISFRYKRFDLSVQVNGAFGHKIYNGTSLTYMNMNIFPDYNVMKKAPGRNIKDQTATDYWLEKGDYINFDYVTVGWNVPVTKWKKYVQSFRLAFTVNNLATITGYSGLSPMINSSTVNSTLGVDDKRAYPLARTYTLGLSINF